MSGLRNPVGDEPPETYWRRRLIVIGVVVLAIVLLWFLISATLAGDGDGEGAASSPDTTPATTLSPDETEAAESDPSRPCTAEDLAVSASAEPSKPQVGSSVAFNVTVEHTGGSACALSNDTESTSMVIGSGPEDVYLDSEWCADSPVFEENSWILEPGASETLQASWNLQRYAEGSCEPGINGTAGTYWVEFSVAGAEAEQTRFELVD